VNNDKILLLEDPVPVIKQSI